MGWDLQAVLAGVGILWDFGIDFIVGALGRVAYGLPLGRVFRAFETKVLDGLGAVCCNDAHDLGGRYDDSGRCGCRDYEIGKDGGRGVSCSDSRNGFGDR